MRRDLKKGCAACRLRFSERLTHCPVCRAAALTVYAAKNQVQPTSRAAWLAKWLIVLAFLPAIGLVAIAGFKLFKEGWPPQSALDIIMYVLGGMGTALGASIVIAIPFCLWYGFVRGVGFLLKYIVDRPRRALRVTIELAPRTSMAHGRHPMHRLWDKLENIFIGQNQDETIRRLWVGGFLAFLGAQALAEIFGDNHIIRTKSVSDFGESLLVLGIINVMGAVVFAIFVGAFGAFAKAAKDFLDSPPTLFGYNPRHPPLQNEETLADYLRNREEIVGRAAPLDESERAALGMDSGPYLEGPVSRRECLAFRLTGHAGEQPVDDAEATNFAVITDDGKRWLVNTENVVLAWKAKNFNLTSYPSEFLSPRGFPRNLEAFGPLDVEHHLMREGAQVRVVGRRTDIRVGSAGYRGDDRRMMLDAGDGLPVVVMPAKEATS